MNALKEIIERQAPPRGNDELAVKHEAISLQVLGGCDGPRENNA
jgi:hypothetical protein